MKELVVVPIDSMESGSRTRRAWHSDGDVRTMPVASLSCQPFRTAEIRDRPRRVGENKHDRSPRVDTPQRMEEQSAYLLQAIGPSSGQTKYGEPSHGSHGHAKSLYPYCLVL